MNFFSLFKADPDGKLGVIKGVYIPNILQMIGVILFMRLGWVLGHVGMLTMGCVITLSSTLIFLTSLSMTAIVSNMKMKGGGSYYLISRSLGIEFGGAIGVLQCVSQLCSIALCITGFSLSVSEIFPGIPLPLLQMMTLAGLVLTSYFSTAFAVKTQIFIFTALAISISSIFWGWQDIPPTLPLFPQDAPMNFWMAFAMFFPAVTGIESGMSMSGDLRNPSRSLPIGTLASVITVYFLYLSIAFFLSQNALPEYLRSYPFILYYANICSPLIVVGVWAATLSSALGAILGGPRVMQAIARDGILPRVLAQGYGPTEQPRKATLVVSVCAAFLILFTNINQIIPIMTVACLVSYSLINFIAFMESFLKNPSWRPTFPIPAVFSLIGSLSCFILMFLINPGAAFIVFLLVVALCFWTSSRKITANWDDIRYSIYSYFIHRGTAKLSNVEKSAKNWRPHILTLVDTPNIQKNLAYFAHAINQEKGFLTFGVSLRECAQDLASTLKRHLKEFHIPSYIHINTYEKPIVAADQMIRNYGFGTLKPNTVLFSLPSTFEKGEFARLLINIHLQRKNIILLKDDPYRDYIYADPSKQKKQIHLWWRGKYPGNFEFSLASAFLLQQSKLWPLSKIMIKMAVKNEEQKRKFSEQFERYESKLRIKNLEFSPILDREGDFFSSLLAESHNADLTFLGLRRPNSNTHPDEYADYYASLLEKTRNISNIAYVLSGEKVQFRKIFL